MMLPIFRITVTVLLIFMGTVLRTAAQAPAGYASHEYFDTTARAHMAMEMQRRSRGQAVDRKKLSAEKRRLEFVQRVATFTSVWNTLMESGAKGVWNPKQAKAAREAFDRLVKADGWFETAK
jgi:hypothetical protein